MDTVHFKLPRQKRATTVHIFYAVTSAQRNKHVGTLSNFSVVNVTSVFRSCLRRGQSNLLLRRSADLLGCLQQIRIDTKAWRRVQTQDKESTKTN